MKRMITLLLLIATLLNLAPATAEEATLKFTPTFDLRVRQEILDGVLFFAPDPDRNWVRFRTRLGLKAESGNHEFSLRLANEHRHIFEPENSDFDWDELIIDQALWNWHPHDETTVTIGRQDIIWDRGFLVLEGHPLDGSRSIYMNGIRLRTNQENTGWDVFAVRNWKYDPIVLAGDSERVLSDMDEIGVAAKFNYKKHSLAFIWKNENDPDRHLPELNTYTLSSRIKWGKKSTLQPMFEVAIQYLDGLPLSEDPLIKDHGLALAMQGQLDKKLAQDLEGDLGFFYYSGDDNGMKSFRTPWGRWPKWSDLYIYTLLGEGDDGRVHVASWENISAARMNLHYQINEDLKARWGLSYLLAPANDWQSRGLLMQSELKFNLHKKIKGHLLWEMLNPGSYQDSLSNTNEVVHFLRWQLTYAF
ncbi:MAG: hypothetical protein GY780_10395 [bacterium]|nr:hypothetical protein [bacterium]